MKKKSTSQSAPARRSLGEGGFFNLRVLIAAVFCLGALAVALFAQTRTSKQSNRSTTRQDAPGTQRPDIVQLVGPLRTTADVRHLPYIPNEGEVEERRLTRYAFPNTGPLPSAAAAPSSPWMQKLLKNIFRPTPAMPGPLLTFDGVNSAASQCGCLPPDTDGDVGPNHYVEAVNVVFKVFDKNGGTLAGPTTFNSLFAPLVGTPCSGQNDGDPFVFYDHMADRWVISDFAFPSLPGNGPFYQCIAVSTSPDPAGTYNLYALQHSDQPGETMWVGDYPKMALWSDPQPGGAYHLTVNLFDGPTLAFEGVRVFALDRGSMLAGGPANAIAFTVPLAGAGDSYSFVAANFRTGDPPPAGRDEMVLAVDATFPGVTLTQVHARFFHVDFANPGMSTFGVGPDHTPNAEITVNPFVQAWTASTYNLVPQQGTSQKLDTLGDKIMTPVVYQNRNGTESLWADQTTMLNFPNGPTAVTWYQFDVTGGTFPATPVQQQEWTNGGDGLWRWMSSIAVDADGNTAIGYSTSSDSIFAGIRYAGRLAGDPSNNLGQGEAIMTNGGGAQTHPAGRWGDYTYTSIDPSDGMTFWHVNEYYTATSSASWATRIGKFDFVGGGGTPTPTPTVRPTPTPRPRPTPHPRP